MSLRLFLVGSALLAAASAYPGFLKLFTRLNGYDDTGYMLALIKSFNENGGLYREVFSQYGPIYSEFYFVLDRLLGIPMTHDGIRWVVLFLWIASSIGAGVVAFQLSRSAWTAILTQMLAFQALELLWADPGHPLSLAVTCLAATAVCVTGLDPRNSRSWRTISAGALVGMLLLIKINLGLFALASLGTAAVFCSPLDRRGRVLRWVVGIIFCGLAAAIIRPPWPAMVRLEFLTVFICSLVAVLVSTRGESFDWLSAARFGICAFAGLLTICVLGVSGVLLTGTGWADLIGGVIVKPMGLARLFWIPPSIPPASVTMAIVSLLAAAGARFVLRWSPTVHRHFSFALRLGFVGAVLAWVTGSCAYWLPFSLLWIAVLPVAAGADTTQFGRIFIVLLTLGQVLGLYPVFGGQQVIPFFLLALAVAPVLGALTAESRLSVSLQRRSWLKPVLVSGLYVTFAFLLIRLSYRESRNLLSEYRRYSPVALPGAHLLRLRPDSVATYRFLAENLRASRPSFVTLPGMNSLYGWSGRPFPTGFNTTMNFALLTESEQRRMLEVASKSQPICLVVNEGLLFFWTRGRFKPSGSLVDFMKADCRSIGRVKGYELMCLKSAAPPLLTSCAILDQEWEPTEQSGRITVRLLARQGTAVSASLLRVSTGKSLGAVPVAQSPALQRFDRGADPSGAVRQFTIELNGASVPAAADLDDCLVQLRNDAGETVAEVPFLRPPK